MNTVLGINYGLSDKLGIFAEFNMISQSAIQSRFEYTKYSVNGKDGLNDLTTNKKEFEYEKEFVANSDTNKNPGEPSRTTAQRMPFSSTGFRIGIQIKL